MPRISIVVSVFAIKRNIFPNTGNKMLWYRFHIKDNSTENLLTVSKNIHSNKKIERIEFEIRRYI